ncbi:MAG: hypothetical protein GEU77_08025 [Deltaproteobacteria bacterium]|nr:hypothetical protein [Deltaproteobacteria bacterium]
MPAGAHGKERDYGPLGELERNRACGRDSKIARIAPQFGFDPRRNGRRRSSQRSQPISPRTRAPLNHARHNAFVDSFPFVDYSLGLRFLG